MAASIQAAGVALPNLAFELIVRSVRQAPAPLQPPAQDQGTGSPTAPLAESRHHIDVSA